MSKTSSRRDFIKQVGATGLGMTLGGLTFNAKSYANIVGANERFHTAVMGTNGRGAEMARSFQGINNVEVSFVCDVEENALAKGVEAVKRVGGNPKTEKDIRRVLENKDLTALVIAAPDHWHATAAIMACQAGKHVYVEKPCSHSPQEGELCIAAARKYNRIMQVGAQRRSWSGIMEGISELHNGIIGQVYFAKGWYTNKRSSIGLRKKVLPPSNLDFDLWQGPAPRRTYQENLVHSNWHWFWHWGTGEALNNGTHEIDVIRWGLGLDFPTHVSSEGARFAFHDDRETPDMQIINLQFGNNCLVTWEGRSCNSCNSEGRDRGVIFYGETGALETGFNGYRIYDLNNQLVKEVDSKEMIDRHATSGQRVNSDLAHIMDFLDAIRDNRLPNGDIATLHKSTTLMQLGNIALRTGQRLTIDPSCGHILNSPEAQALWTRTYEPGWELTV